MHRVLKPGSRLGLVWNLRDARVPWVAKLDAIVNAYEGDSPRYYTGDWRRAFPHPGFGPLAETHFSLGHTGSPDNVIVDRMRSTSFIAALPADERERIDARARAHQHGTGITRQEGRYRALRNRRLRDHPASLVSAIGPRTHAWRH